MTKTGKVASSILAWHGTRIDGTTQHLKIKELVNVKNLLVGNVKLCGNALHGSVQAVDMLQYSEGLWIKRTLHEGVILQHLNKIGSSERTVIAEADATQVVLEWAFWCADRAVRIHAVTALQRIGMAAEAKKLAGLKAITSKKSALAAHRAAIAVGQVIHAAVHAAHISEAAAYATAAAVRAATNAANAANTAAYSATNAAVYTTDDDLNIVYTTCNASYTAAHAAAAAVYAADAAVRAAAHATSNTIYAVHKVNAAVRAAAHAADADTKTDEMDLLNAELERRLFVLMGLNEMEVI